MDVAAIWQSGHREFGGMATGDGRDEALAGAIREARQLIRGATAATLATSADGQPFVALVTPATAPDLAPLLWLSTLSEHTRHLAADPRCALLFTGVADGPNPQTAPRVTLTGLAERVPEAEVPVLKARWLARHPYAALYAGFADFALWRIRPQAALYVGGFALALRLRASQFLPDPAAVAAVATAEPGIIAHMNDDHADACANIARAFCDGEAGEWRMGAIDVDGCDLTDGNRTLRFAFPEVILDAHGVHVSLVRAAREARILR
jgi:putative heme iron utilization protein